MIDTELRKRGIGSSEIAMLVSGKDGKPVSPWGGPHKLWRIKKGFELDDVDTPSTIRGRYLEPALLAYYSDKTKRALKTVPTIQSNRHGVVIDSVDALASNLDGENGTPMRHAVFDRCVEAKTTHYTKRHEWGEPGTDEVPRHYILQAQWHCGAHELPVCDLPVDLGGELEIYTVRYDEDLFMTMVEVAEKFWLDHIETGRPPEPDSDIGTSKWLARKLEQKYNHYLQADKDMTKLLMNYRSAKLALNNLEEDTRKMENDIKTRIGEYAGIEIPGTNKRVTFKMQKGRTDTDWKAIAKDLGVTTSLIEKHTMTKPPFRVFRTSALLKDD